MTRAMQISQVRQKKARSGAGRYAQHVHPAPVSQHARDTLKLDTRYAYSARLLNAVLNTQLGTNATLTRDSWYLRDTQLNRMNQRWLTSHLAGGEGTDTQNPQTELHRQ